MNGKNRIEKHFIKTANESLMWVNMRRMLLRLADYKCMKCGDFEHLQIDHIYPKSIYPNRLWDLSNMQILCHSCNLEKGRSVKDYRTEKFKKLFVGSEYRFHKRPKTKLRKATTETKRNRVERD